jgi:response regulator RpfG family c-di-GMP phosphodiesterase
MTGAELIREMRSNPLHFYVPAMVITASGDRAVRYEALEAGAVDFLTKPLDPIEVRTRCRNWLTLSRQYRQLKSYAELQEAQLRKLRGTVDGIAPEALSSSNVTRLNGTVTVSYAQLFEVTSALSGMQQLARYGMQLVESLERDLHQPLRRPVP